MATEKATADSTSIRDSFVATQLQTLLAGSIVLSVARRSTAPAVTAREAAIALLAAAERA
jgi:hypothetical protein